MKTAGSSDRIRFGAFEADLHTREIRKDGLKLKLTGQPFEILAILLSRPGELITRADLQERLWPDDPFIDARHGLNAAVNKLRDALDDSADDPQYIQTVPRRGYRFIGQIIADPPAEEVSNESAAKQRATDPISPVVLDAPHAPVLIPAAIVVRSNSRQAGWPIFASATIALMVGGFCGLALNHGLQNAKSLLNKRTLEAKTSTEASVVRNAIQNVETAKRETETEAAETNERSPRKLVPKNAILQHDGEHLHLASTVRTIIAGDSGNAGPQFSPDGKHIAFMSNRSGRWQIWMSNADGSNPRQISFTESAGTPRWSPDGKRVAFDAPYDGGTHIFVVEALDMDREHQPRPLVEGLVPSFSRDGKWIYFASERSGDWQVWKVQVSGGEEQRVTSKGGFAAFESADGYVYYAKTRYWSPEIWRVPVNGGEEAMVSPRLRPRTWASWAVTQGGIYFVEDFSHGNSELSVYSPKEQQVHDLAALPSAPFWMGASTDGTKVVMNDAEERQISLLENLR